jgi:large subunit ribosomal protein L22
MKLNKIKKIKVAEQGKALSKFNIISHIKMNAVSREIIHLKYPVAMALLKQIPNRSARIIEKTIKSAYNNLLQVNDKIGEDECVVHELAVGTGPNIKRLRPRARGRADIIKKRSSHLYATVARRA